VENVELRHVFSGYFTFPLPIINSPMLHVSHLSSRARK
jgi:hypothetical protein